MDQSGCAAVSFIVERNGRTSNITVEKVEPAGGLGELAASIASNLEFEPTIINAGRDRVFSSLIFPFNLPPDPEARTIIMQRCVIPARKWGAKKSGK
jgi:outer membrane biosynthesis protein TonB